MIFFGADNKKIVADAMGALRLKVVRPWSDRRKQMGTAVGYRLPDV